MSTLAGLRPAVGSASVMALGTSAFGRHCDEATAVRVIRTALDEGVTVVDTADSYGPGRRGDAERMVGRALRGRRDGVLVCTKVGAEFAGRPASAHPDRIRDALLGSLRRLRTDHVDVYLVHVPDRAVPLADSLGAMLALRDEGLVRAVGVSNHTVADLEAAVTGAGREVRCVQDELSVVRSHAEAELLPWCRARDVGFMAYAPLAQGLLTGKYHDGVPPRSRLGELDDVRAGRVLDAYGDAARRFVQVCRERGEEPTAAALAWVARRPGVQAVVVGATGEEQVRLAARALRPDRSGAVVGMPAGADAMVGETS